MKRAQKIRRQDITPLFHVLGNTTRMRIILDLATGEKCVCTIFRRLKLPQNLVSHHLGILRKHNLIRARKTGKWVHYSLSDETLLRMTKIIRSILDTPKSKSAC